MACQENCMDLTAKSDHTHTHCPLSQLWNHRSSQHQRLYNNCICITRTSMCDNEIGLAVYEHLRFCGNHLCITVITQRPVSISIRHTGQHATTRMNIAVLDENIYDVNRNRTKDLGWDERLVYPARYRRIFNYMLRNLNTDIDVQTA